MEREKGSEKGSCYEFILRSGDWARLVPRVRQAGSSVVQTAVRDRIMAEGCSCPLTQIRSTNQSDLLREMDCMDKTSLVSVQFAGLSRFCRPAIRTQAVEPRRHNPGNRRCRENSGGTGGWGANRHRAGAWSRNAVTAGQVLSRSAWNTRADARMVVRLTTQALRFRPRSGGCEYRHPGE